MSTPRQTCPDVMRLVLMEPHVPVIHCADTRTTAQGRTAATCTLPAGHSGPHTDTHEGRTWARTP